jgi:hypothetical protein
VTLAPTLYLFGVPAYPPLLQIINVFHEDRYLTYPYTVEGNSLNVLTGIKEKFSAYGVVSLTPLELEKHIILESFVKKKIQTNIIKALLFLV